MALTSFFAYFTSKIWNDLPDDVHPVITFSMV